MKPNRITSLFGIEKPIIQGGMVWISGWRLASAVSNAGGLGLLGAGSMHPDTLIEHIHKMKEATDKPWGVNVPLMYPEIERLMQIIIDEGVKIVFTSAGSPKKYTARLHEAGIKVAHVVSSSKFAWKCEQAGVDAIVAEGFEAGALDFASSLFGWVIYRCVASLEYVGAAVLSIITIGMVVWNRMRIVKEEKNNNNE